MKYDTKFWDTPQSDPPITMGQVTWLTNPHNPRAVRMLAAINQIAATVGDAFDIDKLKAMIAEAARDG